MMGGIGLRSASRWEGVTAFAVLVAASPGLLSSESLAADCPGQGAAPAELPQLRFMLSSGLKGKTSRSSMVQSRTLLPGGQVNFETSLGKFRSRSETAFGLLLLKKVVWRPDGTINTVRHSYEPPPGDIFEGISGKPFSFKLTAKFDTGFREEGTGISSNTVVMEESSLKLLRQEDYRIGACSYKVDVLQLRQKGKGWQPSHIGETIFWYSPALKAVLARDSKTVLGTSSYKVTGFAADGE